MEFNFNKFLQSKIFSVIVLSIAAFIILLFVFGLGFFVGSKRADFSFKWADQYHKNFAGPREGFLGPMTNPRNEFIDSNGTIGEIIKIDEEKLTIKGRENVEKIIIVNEKTTIVSQRNNIKITELKIGDNIITMGRPNNEGQIEADFIRIIPQNNVF